MHRKRSLIIVFLAAMAAFAAGIQAAQTAATARDAAFGGLSFDERVSARRAIEQVYHDRREGPEKKSFSSQYPSEAVEKIVRGHLAMSAVLQQRYGVTVGDAALDHELDRMIKSSKDPETLHLLFAVLGNDRHRVKEALVRPIVTERLLYQRFAFDADIHRGVREEMRDLHKQISPGNFRALAGEGYIRSLVRVGEADAPDIRRDDGVTTIERKVSQAAFDGSMRDVPPQGKFSEVMENEHSLLIQRHLPKGPAELEVQTLYREKTTFHQWLADVSPSEEDIPLWSAALKSESSPGGDLPDPRLVSPYAILPCAADTWVNFGPPESRFGHTAVWAENLVPSSSRMIVWGGTNGAGFFFNTGYSYDPGDVFAPPPPAGTADYWAPISNDGAPTGRFYHTAVWTGTEMIVWGGFDGINPLNTGGKYNPATDTWCDVSTCPNLRSETGGAPTARFRHTAVWTGTEMIVWGGWKGYSGSELQDGGRYNPASDTWTLLDSATGTPPSARVFHTAVWSGTEMIIWGGTNTTTQVIYGNGARYNPASNAWLPVASAGAPSARREHTAVWSTSTNEMLVWGGRQTVGIISSISLDTGAHYDPAVGPDGAWTAMPAPPSANPASPGYTCPGRPFCGDTNVIFAKRYGHVALWAPETGEMLIWGGIGANNSGNDTDSYGGARYNAATQTWIGDIRADISNASSRRDIVAVWTTGLAAPVMITWDGRSPGAFSPVASAQGGQYDSSINTWMPVGLNNAPEPRHSHSVTWTGLEIIVWGGVGITVAGEDSNILGGGAMYYPATDTWSVMSDVSSLSKDCRCDNAKTAPTASCANCALVGADTCVAAGGVCPASTKRCCAPGFTCWPVLVGGQRRCCPVGETCFVVGSALRYCPAADGTSQCGTAATCCPPPGPCVTGTASPLISFQIAKGRARHTATWTGTRMAVLGGDDPITYSSKVANPPGGRCFSLAYDPLLNVWSSPGDCITVNYCPGGDASKANATCSPTALAPFVMPGVTTAQRELHTSLWSTTSSNVLMMHGWAPVESLFHSTGYMVGNDADFTSCASAAMSATNAPAPRIHHSAVWTGTETLVWGGQAANGAPLNNGKRYSPPPLDTWATINTSGAPSVRSLHTAVWSGTEMLVWGGRCGSICGAVGGGRYDPTGGGGLGTWGTAIPQGPLTSRYRHSAVWDAANAQMIVWGGYDITTGQYASDGARYNPAAPPATAWTPLPTVNAPIGRYDHTAVWDDTRNRMFIWGGFLQGQVASRTGSFYFASKCSSPPPPAAGSQSFGEVPSLSVSRAQSSHDVRLNWQPSCQSSDFAVYMGRLDVLKRRGAYGHWAAACTTGEGTENIASDDGLSNMYYYLVVPHNGVEQGSFGKDSDGNERPAGVSACYQENLGSCP